MYIAFGYLSHSISSYDGHSKNYKWYTRDKIAVFHMHSVEKGEGSLLFKKNLSIILVPFHRNYFVNVSAFISLAFRSEGYLPSL